MRTMYDSVNPRAIPRDAEVVAGYVDGIYAWTTEEWALFPNSVKVRISAIGVAVGHVGDVERGCIWPVGNAVPWVLRARAAGYDPTIYVNEKNDWEPCRAAFRAAGVPEPHWWVANYDGRQIIPAGAVGKQYAHPGASWEQGYESTVPWETGEHFDVSVVVDHWPGVDSMGSGSGGGAGEDDMRWNEEVELVSPLNPQYKEDKTVGAGIAGAYYHASDARKAAEQAVVLLLALQDKLDAGQAELLAAVRAGDDPARIAEALAPLLPSTDGASPGQVRAILDDALGRIFNLPVSDTTN